MGETVSRLFTPPNSGLRGLPKPVTRDDPAVADARRSKQMARIAATGFGSRMRLTSPLGETDSGGSRRSTLVGEIGS